MVEERRRFVVASTITPLEVDIPLVRVDGIAQPTKVVISGGQGTLWEVDLLIPDDERLPQTGLAGLIRNPLSDSVVELAYEKKPIDTQGGGYTEFVAWFAQIGPMRFEVQIRTSMGALMGSILVSLEKGDSGNRDPLNIDVNGAWEFGEG